LELSLNLGGERILHRNPGDEIPKDVDAESAEIPGYTLLHLASRHNNSEVIYVLVKFGADVKGAVSGGFSSRFVKTSLKLTLNAFTHTQKAPRTSRARCQVNFCRESKP